MATETVIDARGGAGVTAGALAFVLGSLQEAEGQEIPAGDLALRAASHVLNRLGYGPRPGDIDRVVHEGIERYVNRQLDPGPDTALDQRLSGFTALNWSMAETWSRFLTDQATGRDADPTNNTNNIGTLNSQFREAQIIRAVHSENQLLEVMTWFWFNHFNVNLPDNYVRYSAHDYEKELRKNALGTFKDLLLASAHHPAMMDYLDNYLSTISRYDRTGRLTSGLNENYGRELMELHTVGVDAGYSQDDVYNAASVLTGWSYNAAAGRFQFNAANHDPKATQVFGLSVPAGMMQQSGEMLLDYLAKHEKTATFISSKLVRHFVNDDPPPALVTRVADTFLSTGGDIKAMLKTIIGSTQFWAEAFGPGKYKDPFQYVASTLRAVDADVTAAPRTIPAVLSAMGQPQYACIPPTGWTDKGREWINPSSQLSRVNFALDLVSSGSTTPFPGVTVNVDRLLRNAGVDVTRPRDVATFMNRQVFGNRLSANTLDAAANVSPAGVVAVANRTVGLILAGPEAQGR